MWSLDCKRKRVIRLEFRLRIKLGKSNLEASGARVPHGLRTRNTEPSGKNYLWPQTKYLSLSLTLNHMIWIKKETLEAKPVLAASFSAWNEGQTQRT